MRIGRRGRLLINAGTDANEISEYLWGQDYETIPVNSTVTEVLERPAYDSLSEVEEEIDIMDVFRPSPEVAGSVDELLAGDSNGCPVGIAARRTDLRNRLVIDSGADGVQNYFEATTKLMRVMARACGHDSLSGFERRDLTTWNTDIADPTGVEYAGVGHDRRPNG